MELKQLLETALHTCQLSLDAPVLVGVSGGPDSLCLLDGLARLQFPVIAAHFDHRLRPESAQEAERVRAAAGALGVPFTGGSGDVAQVAREEHRSLEEAARELRYRFLFAQAQRFSAQAVAVGHTADDQVETVLMHLLRGAGLNGLQGMRFRSLAPAWNGAVPLVRPLLGFWRAETLAYCQERGLQPVFDPTNQDVAFFRNRLRHELIPALESYQPQVRQNVWRMAQILAGEDAILQASAQAAWNACLVEARAGTVVLRQAEFRAMEVGLQRRVLRQAVGDLQEVGDLRDVDFDTVERAIRFALRKRAGSVDLSQGLRLTVEGGRMLVSAGDPPLSADWPQLAAAGQHACRPRRNPVEFRLAAGQPLGREPRPAGCFRAKGTGLGGLDRRGCAARTVVPAAGAARGPLSTLGDGWALAKAVGLLDQPETSPPRPARLAAAGGG